MGGRIGGIAGALAGVGMLVYGALTGGTGFLLGGALLAAGGVASLTFRPKAEGMADALTQELRVSPAAVGVPVPVVFGEARVTPNWIKYDLKHFRSVEVKSKVKTGGKGGGSSATVTEYVKYGLDWEMALCMGPLDAVGAVYSMPGEKVLFEAEKQVNVVEFTTSGNWTVPAGVTSVEVLVVGGGGGGGWYSGNKAGGGGGGGQVVYQKGVKVTPGQVVPITVGQGGAAGTQSNPQGGNGGDSAFGTIVAKGGGGGGAGGGAGSAGANGGGGGGGWPAGVGGAGQQGYAGGTGVGVANRAYTWTRGGGGGGASEMGKNAIYYRSGRGGNGVLLNVTGVEMRYGDGGSGGGDENSPMGTARDAHKVSGAPRLGDRNGRDGAGGGGQGGWANGPNPWQKFEPGRGGSGVVVVRYEVTGPQWIEFGNDDYVVLDMEGENEEGEDLTFRVYRGSATQTRPGLQSGGFTDVYYEDPPYRGVAFVTCSGWIGRTTSVRTYHFVVRRLPRCVRDDGTEVTGLKTRGSDDPAHPNYHNANPAAVVYEVLTNKLWGRGLSSDLIDEPSFVQVSQFYAARNIGVGFVLENVDEVEEVLRSLYTQLKLLLVWDGLKFKLKTTLDVAATHSAIVTLRSSDIGNFRVQVPTWDAGVANEVRAEYVSRDRGYRSDVAHVQDLAGIEVAGGRSSGERLTLSAVNDDETARMLAHKVLAEVAFPWAQAQWEMKRAHARIEVGDAVRVVWERVDGQVETTYWLVTSVEDHDPASEVIRVTAVQDDVLPPAAGEETSVTLPDKPLWERVLPTAQSEIAPGEAPDLAAPPLDPVLVMELPAIRTGGTQRVLVQGESSVGWVSAVGAVWSHDQQTWLSLGTFPLVAVACVLEEDVEWVGHTDRQRGILARLLHPETWMGTVLGVNEVPSDRDHLWTLLLKKTHWIYVNDELMQAGRAEPVDSERVRFVNIVRGRLGTRMRPHKAGDRMFYMSTLGDGIEVRDVPMNVPVFWQVWPIAFNGRQVGSATMEGTTHPDPHDTMWLGVGARPLPPEVVNVERAGNNVTLTIRPRHHGAGGGVVDTKSAINNPVTSLNGLGFAVEWVDANGDVMVQAPVQVSGVFTPGTLAEAGKVVLNFDVDGGAKLLRVYSVRGGLRSVNWSEVVV